MSAKRMSTAEDMRLNGDLAEYFDRAFAHLVPQGGILPGGASFFDQPDRAKRLTLQGITRVLAGVKEGTEAKAAAHRLANDDFDDDDPIRRAYPGESGGAYAEALDEGGGVHVEDDDDDWQDGEDAAAASIDKFFPKRKSDTKSGDAPRATPKASDGPKQTPLARLLRTDGGGTGKPDHEPAERKPSSALSRFLERRRK